MNHSNKAHSPKAAAVSPGQTLGGLAGLSEGRRIALLVGGAVVLGGFAQLFVEPGPKALVPAAGLGAVALFVLSRLLPGRWRETMAGFRFTATLLFALGGCAILGTLVLQGRPLGDYPARYGLVGDLIVALRLDDIFHSLWFGLLAGLFLTGVVTSALLRLPLRVRNVGFFTCHVGLLATMLGAGLSSFLSVRGRVDLLAGGSAADRIDVTRGGQGVTHGLDARGAPVAVTAPLGFELRLDRFELVRYETEFRVGYYEPRLLPDGRPDWRLAASFDPVPGERHVLPGGSSFVLEKLFPDYRPGEESPALARGAEVARGPMKNPAAVVRVNVAGESGVSEPLQALEGRNYVPVAPVGSTGPHGMLVFEKRDQEAKSYRSDVTALAGGEERKARVAVNEPFTFRGWTFYQANYDPANPKYSGLDAVYDPGVPFVFAGFALIVAGVFYMFYVEGRLPRRAVRAHPAEARAAA